ncbi:MAG: sugar transferase [Planctomycetaceae bacterium]|nr:sugar transferase [Planctomycetaceae bacterium]
MTCFRTRDYIPRVDARRRNSGLSTGDVLTPGETEFRPASPVEKDVLMAKRCFDIVLSSIGILLAGPAILALAAIVKLTSPGPVLYCGVRVGRHNKPFRIMKFRSMVVNAEKLGAASTAGHDPRITKIGHFMRKYKLDELPQLFNVWLGTMSFVGPRPEVQKFVDMYTDEEKIILNMRPGITDWASIWNSDEGHVLDGAPDADAAYAELIRPTKLQLQMKYAREHSVWTDMKIIFYTFAKLTQKGWLPPEIRHFGHPQTYKEKYGDQPATEVRRAA